MKTIETLKRVKSSHAVANSPDSTAYLLECQHVLVLPKSKGGAPPRQRPCPVCTKAAQPELRVGVRQALALVEKMGGAGAVLEFLVQQEALRKSRQLAAANARAALVKKKQANGHAASMQ